MEGYVHTVSIKFAFDIVSKLTGVSVEKIDEKYYSDKEFQSLVLPIIDTHSNLLFAKEEIAELKDSSNIWRETAELFSR